MPQPRLVGTHIVTPNLPRLARFYESVLGHAPTGSEEYLAFRTSGIVLAICSQRAADVHVLGAMAPGGNRSVVLDFEVADVDADRRRLDSIISTFVLEPTTLPWGNRSMLFRDPDGNLINFFTRPDVSRSQ